MSHRPLFRKEKKITNLLPFLHNLTSDELTKLKPTIEPIRYNYLIIYVVIRKVPKFRVATTDR